MIGCCFGYTAGVTCCCCCCYPYKSVDKGSRAVIQEFGRVKRQVSEGMHYVNPLTEKITSVNLKVQVIDLGHQTLITCDQLSFKCHSVVYYKITNIDKALFEVDNIHQSIIQLSYTSLRDIVGNLL